VCRDVLLDCRVRGAACDPREVTRLEMRSSSPHRNRCLVSQWNFFQAKGMNGARCHLIRCQRSACSSAVINNQLLSNEKAENVQGLPVIAVRAKTYKEQDFDCPVCHAKAYVRLPYKLPDGSQKQGSFYRCVQCDFGFTDPPMFRRRKSSRVH